MKNDVSASFRGAEKLAGRRNRLPHLTRLRLEVRQEFFSNLFDGAGRRAMLRGIIG
jgi:hypothetical protein